MCVCAQRNASSQMVLHVLGVALPWSELNNTSADQALRLQDELAV